MRIGYFGRGLVYLTVAGFSLYAIWYGGQAKDADSALTQLERTTGGSVVLVLIFLGMVAYAVWRAVDAAFDLDAHGDGLKGWVVRAGILVSGLVHLAIASAAFSLLFTGRSEGDGSSIPQTVDSVMRWPGGRWIIGLAGLAVLGFGIAYGVKAWRQTYRRRLRANQVTRRYKRLLQFGVFSHAVIIAIIGCFFIAAAWQADPSEAGGTAEAFRWVSGQPYGQALVAAICVGLLGFALFCFVNAFYRIVPRCAGPDIETLARQIKDGARRAVA